MLTTVVGPVGAIHKQKVFGLDSCNLWSVNSNPYNLKSVRYKIFQRATGDLQQLLTSRPVFRLKVPAQLIGNGTVPALSRYNFRPLFKYRSAPFAVRIWASTAFRFHRFHANSGSFSNLSK